jgi:hypothetical protein
MSDDRVHREHEAVRQYLDAYSTLVARTATHAQNGTEAVEVREAVDEMSESEAKGMLMSRIYAEAAKVASISDQLLDNDNPTMH